MAYVGLLFERVTGDTVIKFHEALVPLVPVFSNPVMFLLLFEQSVNMHVCTSRAKKN